MRGAVCERYAMRTRPRSSGCWSTHASSLSPKVAAATSSRQFQRRSLGEYCGTCAEPSLLRGRTACDYAVLVWHRNGNSFIVDENRSRCYQDCRQAAHAAAFSFISPNIFKFTTATGLPSSSNHSIPKGRIAAKTGTYTKALQKTKPSQEQSL